MRGHVDAESLALYAEGQLSRGRTARVRAHLSGCAECGTTAAALTDVSTQLSHVPAPSMPSAFAARLDAALSAETAHRAATPTPAPTPPPRPPRWSPNALRILAGTAVALVVAGGVGYAVSQNSGSPSFASGSSPTARAGPSAGHRSVQGAPFMSPGPVEKPNKSKPSGPVYARTSTDYQPSTLAAQAKNQLREYTMPRLSGPGQIPAAKVPGPVRSCLRHLDGGRPVLFVDLARYQQRPAIVVVLSDPGQAVAASHSCAVLHSARLTLHG